MKVTTENEKAAHVVVTLIKPGFHGACYDQDTFRRKTKRSVQTMTTYRPVHTMRLESLRFLDENVNLDFIRQQKE